MRSLRIAARTLNRHKGFTIVAVLSLAIAIALNTTMYSVLDAMLDPRIGARQPDHLYTLRYYGDMQRRLAPGAIDDALRTGLSNLEGVTGYRLSQRYGMESLAEYGQRYRRVAPVEVRPNFFEVLGTRPLHGRVFAAADEHEAVAVISDRLARALFDNEPAVGRPITIDRDGYVVIGVVRRNAIFEPLVGDVWIHRTPTSLPIRVNVVRFRERVDPPEVEGELATVAAQLAYAAGEHPKDTRFYGTGFATRQFKIEKFHLALFAAVLAVLLVACANLANLQLARGLARSRELALRAAVGASRRQLIQHLLTESAVLAVIGLLVGLLLTLWGIHVVTATVPPAMNEYVIEPQTSWRVFAFAAVSAVVCLFLVGLVPAWRVSRVDPDTLLKSGAGTGASRADRRRYGLMVIAQIGFALPVLIGAIIVLQGAWILYDRDFWIRQVDGYDAEPLIGGNAWLPPSKTRVTRGELALSQELVGRARAVPGIVDAATETAGPPLKRVSVDEPNGMVREEPAPQWRYRVVSPGYFRTKGRAIVRGRDFAEGDVGPFVIMDAGSARYLWGTADPIGRMIKFSELRADAPWHRVIGIVGDLRDTAAIRRNDYAWGFRLGSVYRPVSPADSLVTGPRRATWIAVHARAPRSTELAAMRLQRELRSVHADVQPALHPLVEVWGRGPRRVRQAFVASLFATFAFIGIGLVGIGVYGIVAHTVAERKRELAVRISLGATARDVLHAVLREGNALILAGVALGLLLTRDSIWWLTPFFGEDDAGYDALLMALVAAGLFLLAVLAALAPAWRATRIDPVEALRHE